MIITKTITKVYTGITVVRNFCKFDAEFKRIRLRVHDDKSMGCFKCETPFTDGDNVNIFFMAKDGNKLCCDKCADEFTQEVSDG